MLWDVNRRTPISLPLTGHTNAVNSLAFSHDGQMLASGSLDHTIRLWDVARRQALGRPLAGHTNSVTSLAFNTDATILASGSADGTIVMWDLNVDSWQARACRIANRNLTQAEWNQFLGSDISYQRTCPGLPPGTDAPPDAPAAVR